MVWLFGSTLLFLWVQSWVVAVFAGLAWPALWKAADWDPNFLDVLVITLQETPPTTNRKLHGGEPMRLRIFVDRSVIQVFANYRQCAVRRVYSSRDESLGVSVRSQGIDATLRSPDAWQMEHK